MQQEDHKMWIFEEPFIEAEGENKGVLKEEEAQDCLDHCSEGEYSLLI